MVGRMLKHLGLCSKISCKYKHTTDSNHRLHTAPNLLDRQFTATKRIGFGYGQQTLHTFGSKKVSCIYV